MKRKDAIDFIKKRTALLNEYCHYYYDLDKPKISDKEYDELFDELDTFEKEYNFYLPTSPTHKVQGTICEKFNKIEHSKPMLSAAKTKNPEDIKSFLNRREFYCSYKLDGLTLVAIYEDGEFKQAITRGNGISGEDVTEQAKMITNLPMKIPFNERLELRGECVISWKNFHEINEKLSEPYSHPRNLAAGSLRNLDTNVTKSRKLSYIVFECVDGYQHVAYNSKYGFLTWIESLGFDIVETACINDKHCFYNNNDIETCIKQMDPNKYEYPVDGLIFELDNNDISMQLEATAHHESCRMALKWQDDLYETRLLDIEWNVSRNGTLTPVAVFEPVNIDGSKIERASLHNVSILKQILGTPYNLQKIKIYKSNMIIPQVYSAEKKELPDILFPEYYGFIVVPEECPVCGHKTEIVNTNGTEVLKCTNHDCISRQIAKFTHFVSRNAANIEGLSERTLELFINNGYIKCFRDIYHLNDYRNELIHLDGFGLKSVENLLTSIEKSKSIKLENFINALGIENIGLSAAKTISKYFYGSFDAFYTHATLDSFNFNILDDFGLVMNDSIKKYMYLNSNSVNLLSKEFNFIEPTKPNSSSLAGLKFCITGTFTESRNVLIEKLENKGASFISGVSKNIDILFCGKNAGSKLKKAQQLGVKIIEENELYEMLNK